MAYAAGSNPFASAGLSQFGRDSSYVPQNPNGGGGGGGDLGNFLTAYLVNKSGLQTWMDKAKAEMAGKTVGNKPPTANSVPANPAALSTNSAAVPPNNMGVTVGQPMSTSNSQMTPLAPWSATDTLSTDQDGLDILNSGKINTQGQ